MGALAKPWLPEVDVLCRGLGLCDNDCGPLNGWDKHSPGMNSDKGSRVLERPVRHESGTFVELARIVADRTKQGRGRQDRTAARLKKEGCCAGIEPSGRRGLGTV